MRESSCDMRGNGGKTPHQDFKLQMSSIMLEAYVNQHFGTPG
jgi:hypothetical protein